MATQPQPVEPTTIDPDNVPEILCEGRYNVHALGQIAVITFAHFRPDAHALLDDGKVQHTAVVRARIAMSLSSLVLLRDLLNRTIQENPPPGTKIN